MRMTRCTVIFRRGWPKIGFVTPRHTLIKRHEQPFTTGTDCCQLAKSYGRPYLTSAATSFAIARYTRHVIKAFVLGPFPDAVIECEIALPKRIPLEIFQRNPFAIVHPDAQFVVAFLIGFRPIFPLRHLICHWHKNSACFFTGCGPRHRPNVCWPHIIRHRVVTVW